METSPQTSPEAAQVRIDRHYPVPVDKVWRAWTEPQALNRWFGAAQPGNVTEAEIDLRVGGRFRIVTRQPGGQTNDVSGIYQEVVPHRRLVFTWAWRSTPDRVSRVSIDLHPQDGGCALRFVHDRFFDEPARISHARGWSLMFEQLDAVMKDEA